MDDLLEKRTVLVVEDDKEIARLVSTNIEDMGLETKVVHDGKSGLDQARKGTYDLIILDLMLPEIDGMSLCRKIRESDTQTAIMILTAKAEEIDRVLGLELGADDYMTKPFSVREMTARVKALLRRTVRNEISCSDEEQNAVAIGAVSVDFEKHRVLLAGEVLDLTVKEFELLSLFVRNPGRVFSRQDLLSKIWGYQFEGYEHTVNTHINRLRNKIEKDPSHPEYLLTVWGIGYRFAEGDDL
ncbi:MAG: response regulator transcription factor [Spirochaetales bacterium]|nr:response regulator transcription factor [Spirochaetales bacterium]